MSEELIKRFSHTAEDYPFFSRQTHKVLRNKQIVSETININENLIHYVQDTALLISRIDGSIEDDDLGGPFDHVVYLDKSARPVSWLVGMLWDSFAEKDQSGKAKRIPQHSYINIDRSPWFRNVGIQVTDDGRQKENGELATYGDFVSHIRNLSKRHLAEIRALYIDGGIEKENVGEIMGTPSILDGKRVLIVDEVARTGATLNIAVRLFQEAFPDASEIRGTHFWHPQEPPLVMGSENVLTSLPVWYDPATLIGRGIGGINEEYHRKRYEKYMVLLMDYPGTGEKILRKLRTYAFSASVYSAPLLNEDGSLMDYGQEKRTRALLADMRKLKDDFERGRILFAPPIEWMDDDRFEDAIFSQGLKMIPLNATDLQREEIRRDPLFYLNFISALKIDNST